MNMVPIYSSSGQLLGHLNMVECGKNRDSVTVTDMLRSLKNLSSFDDVELRGDTLKYFHVPLRTLRFRCEAEEQKILYLVADELPDWFWDAYSTVKFSSDHWERYEG
jgi:hypothetical protein